MTGRDGRRPVRRAGKAGRRTEERGGQAARTKDTGSAVAAAQRGGQRAIRLRLCEGRGAGRRGAGLKGIYPTRQKGRGGSGKRGGPLSGRGRGTSSASAAHISRLIVRRGWYCARGGHARCAGRKGNAPGRKDTARGWTRDARRRRHRRGAGAWRGVGKRGAGFWIARPIFYERNFGEVLVRPCNAWEWRPDFHKADIYLR